MISFEEAYKIVLSQSQDYGEEVVSIKNAMGRVLAEDILADRDFPPFNRSTKDGIAINYDAVENGRLNFEIKGVLAAGKPTLTLEESDGCIEIMTGAVVPFETDTVVMYEDIKIKDDIASLKKIPNRGQNIHLRASDEKKGAVLLKKYLKLSAAELGILATVGKDKVTVKKRPRIAVISTGNELVAIDEQPLIHQIRRSNSYSLYGALIEIGITPMLLHISDDKDLLRQKLAYVIEEMDVLILSGGVSMGKFDFIPEIFRELGVDRLFHKVAQRPGKPFWFGTQKTSNTLVFSFPGNPVSTYANFYIYFKAWLQRSQGYIVPELLVKLNDPVEVTGELTHFMGAKIKWGKGNISASLISANGSGDLLSLAKLDGFIQISTDKKTYNKGELVPFIPTRTLF
jgi:molybdopterin molybdotransferase